MDKSGGDRYGGLHVFAGNGSGGAVAAHLLLFGTFGFPNMLHRMEFRVFIVLFPKRSERLTPPTFQVLRRTTAAQPQPAQAASTASSTAPPASNPPNMAQFQSTVDVPPNSAVHADFQSASNDTPYATPHPLLPYVPKRLSSASAPWVHAGLQRGSLDVDGLSRALALQIDPKLDEGLVNLFRVYFQNISNFDTKSCNLAAEAMNSPLAAASAFHYLGIETLPIAPARPNKACQAWIASKLVPMALADRLAWVAQPTELAPEVSPRFKSTTLLDREKKIAHWWHSLVAARLYLKQHPMALSGGETSSLRKSRCEELTLSVTRSHEDIFAANLRALVYVLRAFLMGDPELKEETIVKLVQEDATDDWTQEDRDRAVQNTDILSLAATVLAACIFHSGGVLTTTPIAGRNLWPFIEAWFCGGNPHIVTETYCLTPIDHKLWLILLRAALGRLPLNEIMPTYFRDVQVKQILDNEPSPVELQCLERTVPVVQNIDTTTPLPPWETYNLYSFEDHFDDLQGVPQLEEHASSSRYVDVSHDSTPSPVFCVVRSADFGVLPPPAAPPAAPTPIVSDPPPGLMINDQDGSESSDVGLQSPFPLSLRGVAPDADFRMRPPHAVSLTNGSVNIAMSL
ncbi:hypothetical protein B0H13DRAFT_1920557 [Mycena leptocephala]|nr:hypothetical protein B0H13DRAFT_1920557 [Mycena leptocephala]